MSRRGFTLAEMALVLLIIGVAAAGMGAVFVSSSNLVETNATDLDFQREAARAMDRILGDLRQTGRVDLGGGAVYPYLYDDGMAAGAFAGYTHAPACQNVPPGSPAYGPSTELVFKTLEDQDGDGKYTDAATGTIEWSGADYGYRLVTGADGVNRLMRQVDGAGGTEVARGIERVRFEEQADDPSLGPNQVRITLDFAKPDPQRRQGLVTARFSSVVNMRNVAGQGDIQ